MSSAAFPQGRQVDREHVKPVIEVLAELALRDHLRQVAVRRRDQPHVHLDRLRTAEPFELLFLKHPKQLRL